jgi:hypothetical protein
MTMTANDDAREFLPSTGAIREQRRRDQISADGQRFGFALPAPAATAR